MHFYYYSLPKNLKRIKEDNPTADFGEIQKWRFKADQIDIENDVWVADKIIITNDPYNKPQLLFNNYNSKVINQNGDLVFNSKWSSLVLDNKLNCIKTKKAIKHKIIE